MNAADPDLLPSAHSACSKCAELQSILAEADPQIRALRLDEAQFSACCALVIQTAKALRDVSIHGEAAYLRLLPTSVPEKRRKRRPLGDVGVPPLAFHPSLFVEFEIPTAEPVEGGPDGASET